MKIIKTLLLILVVGFGGFVVWMNVTPGHFELVCDYTDVILPSDFAIGYGNMVEACPLSRFENGEWSKELLVQTLNSLDFYK